MLLSDGRSHRCEIAPAGRLMRPELHRIVVISSLMKSQPLQHVNDNQPE
jgi:hypothetical protein